VGDQINGRNFRKKEEALEERRRRSWRRRGEIQRGKSYYYESVELDFLSTFCCLFIGNEKITLPKR